MKNKKSKTNQKNTSREKDNKEKEERIEKKKKRSWSIDISQDDPISYSPVPKSKRLYTRGYCHNGFMMAAIPYTFPVYIRAHALLHEMTHNDFPMRQPREHRHFICEITFSYATTDTRRLSMFTRLYMMNNRRPEISRAWKWKFSRGGRLISTYGLQITECSSYFDECVGGVRLTRFRHEVRRV